MDVTLLYFDGCPNWRTTARILDDLSAELGFEVSKELIADVADAEERKFRGSPTVLIDGVDPFADEEGPPIGFACRVYSTSEGLRGSPTADMLRAALTA